MKPCLFFGGWDSRRTRTTSGYENHSGIWRPVRRRLRSSVPLMSRTSRFGRNLVFWFVFILVGEVGHLLEGHDFDAELVAVPFDCVLGVVGSVELLSFGVFAGSGVVSAYDEVGGAVVLADDGVPDGFAGTSHSHGQREQSEDSHSVGISGK